MRSWIRFACSTPIQDRISAAFSRSSPNTRPEREIVYPENNGEMMPILSLSNGSRPWKLTPSTHPRAVQKMWIIRNRYGRTYAKFCIFPSVSISNGRHLTRLRDIWTCSTKSGVFYASPCYMSCKQRRVAEVALWWRPATGTWWRCSVLQKKLTWSDMSLLVISTKSIELVFCLSVLPQIYFLSFDLEIAA